MKIEFDWKVFTFSDISMDEFRAIRKFMNLGQAVVTVNGAKGDEGIKEIGHRLTNQIEEVTITGI